MLDNILRICTPQPRPLVRPCPRAPPTRPTRWREFLRAGPGRIMTEEGTYHCLTSCTSRWCVLCRPKSPKAGLGEKTRDPFLASACTTVVVVRAVAAVGWARHAPTLIMTVWICPPQRPWRPEIDVVFGHRLRVREAVGRATRRRPERNKAPHGAVFSAAGRNSPWVTMSVAQTWRSEISGQPRKN